MDYILQAEKIIKYLEFNLEFQDIRRIREIIKNIFHNDLNLFGCFLKDFLTIENRGEVPDDDYIYNDFVLCFERQKDKQEISNFLDKISRYTKHYLSLVFEDTHDRVLLSTIASINSCYAIEYYPFMIELIDSFTIGKIDSISYALMLQSISDKVFKNFESDKPFEISLIDLRQELEKIVLNRKSERLVV